MKAILPGLRLAAGIARGRHFDCELLVTLRCNLRCRFCGVWRRSGQAPAELDAAGWRRIAAALADEGSMIFSIEGGEPLLRSDLEEIVEASAHAGHHPLVTTNGIALTAERARSLFAAGLAQASVSLDYASPARHDAHRGGQGTHAAALAALCAFRDAAPRGVPVTAMTVLMADNVDEFSLLLETTAGLGVGHEVTLLSTASGVRAPGGPRPPASGVGRRLLELRRRFAHLRVIPAYLEQVDGYLAGQPVLPCRAGRQGFAITPAGQVAPCIDRLEMAAGNLAEEPWAVGRRRLAELPGPRSCNACYTLCRGLGATLRGVRGAVRFAHIYG